MAARIVVDQDKASATIEIALEKPLPDYGLEQLQQATPRDVDAVLVKQGFRDLVDDARGVLTELLNGSGLEIAQLAGAICPGDDEVYHPGLWIVLRDTNVKPRSSLTPTERERVCDIAAELVERLGL